ncbi:hypothetical protein EVAR_4537_1 [Eumeta japonica]|uniref:Uncharacterized protein n=1 Tax=Eumeta variegata TaxID=151549 RepID=A0A4C1SWS5_EUMVA|nr:hypothetical protein EVAR_4537_1 [Eumeta japonica]
MGHQTLTEYEREVTASTVVFRTVIESSGGHSPPSDIVFLSKRAPVNLGVLDLRLTRPYGEKGTVDECLRKVNLLRATGDSSMMFRLGAIPLHDAPKSFN